MSVSIVAAVLGFKVDTHAMAPEAGAVQAPLNADDEDVCRLRALQHFDLIADRGAWGIVHIGCQVSRTKVRVMKCTVSERADRGRAAYRLPVRARSDRRPLFIPQVTACERDEIPISR